MSYKVKEIFKTIQGEGALVGSVAVFCRFSGCNLWSGREKDRTTAICKFCDTDFVGGKRYASPVGLANAIEQEWGPGLTDRMVVFTGGEPALQMDHALVSALQDMGFFVAVETNGTIALKCDVDWKCISPKAGVKIIATSADELKVVYPQPFDLPALANTIKASYKSVQPMDGPDIKQNTLAAIEFCFANPDWGLSLQMHKFAGLR